MSEAWAPSLLVVDVAWVMGSFVVGFVLGVMCVVAHGRAHVRRRQRLFKQELARIAQVRAELARLVERL